MGSGISVSRRGNRAGLPGIRMLLGAVALAAAACGGGSGDEEGRGSEETGTSTSAEPPATDSVPVPSTTAPVPSATASTARRVRPVPGPPSPAFFTPGLDYYDQLKDLDPTRCAALVQDLAFLDERPPDADFSYEHFALFVFRGAALGCANRAEAARADLGCARFIQGRVQGKRDPAVDRLLVWALESYGPAPRSCRHPSVATTSSTSSSSTTSSRVP